ncbi:AraC-type DNA-binding protein [Chryseobacterium soldanellicola]|uniref:AraC-type DNA-binding protein n=2 Tax=Chryseobacterium soldanellicola TaxID=311333 RepID=A0A1H1F9N1_9FLAO|nr:AraC-type DNA-binding protein [Chryseobacterium soldanellicola]
MMPFSAFNGKLKSGLHYKNKFYAVLLFENADGSIIIDNREFQLKSHTFFFINYNQVYYFKDQQSIEGEVILFTKSFYNHVYTGNKMIKSDTALHNVPPFISLKPENISDIKQTLKELRSEYQSHQQSRKEILCLLLKVFVLKYIRNSSKKDLINRSVDHKKKLVDDFNDLVNLHYKELKTTSKYAEKLNINSSYLNTLVKEILDITAGQVIKNRIILEAERLLLHSSLSIIEISYELGFNDNSHFGKYFKSVRGVSPNNFRKVQLK